MSKTIEYALYQGDKYLSQGSLQEIAKKTGYSYTTLNFARYPVYRKRCETNKINYDKQLFVVRLGEKKDYE